MNKTGWMFVYCNKETKGKNKSEHARSTRQQAKNRIDQIIVSL
jgi:hypothetical protein